MDITSVTRYQKPWCLGARVRVLKGNVLEMGQRDKEKGSILIIALEKRRV